METITISTVAVATPWSSAGTSSYGTPFGMVRRGLHAAADARTAIA